MSLKLENETIHSENLITLRDFIIYRNDIIGILVIFPLFSDFDNSVVSHRRFVQWSKSNWRLLRSLAAFMRRRNLFICHRYQ